MVEDLGPPSHPSNRRIAALLAEEYTVVPDCIVPSDRTFYKIGR